LTKKAQKKNKNVNFLLFFDEKPSKTTPKGVSGESRGGGVPGGGVRGGPEGPELHSGGLNCPGGVQNCILGVRIDQIEGPELHSGGHSSRFYRLSDR